MSKREKLLFFLWTAVVSCSFSSATDYEWWDVDWLYRKPIDLRSNTDNLSDYQIKLTINLTDEYINGRINQSGKDIRFVNSTNHQINFWIESFSGDGANSIIWIKVPNVPNNANETIYLYYGNPTAESASEVTNLFYFYDDFTSDDLWERVDASIWDFRTIDDRSVLQVEGGTTWRYGRTKNSYNLENTVTEIMLRTILSTGDVDFAYCLESGTKNAVYGFTGLSYFSDSISGNTGVRAYVNGGYTSGNSNAQLTNSWNTLKVTVTSNALIGTYNGYTVTRNVAPNVFNAPLSLGTDNDAGRGVYVDWIRIYQYTSTDPTISTNPTQFGLIDVTIYGNESRKNWIEVGGGVVFNVTVDSESAVSSVEAFIWNSNNDSTDLNTDQADKVYLANTLTTPTELIWTNTTYSVYDDTSINGSYYVKFNVSSPLGGSYLSQIYHFYVDNASPTVDNDSRIILPDPVGGETLVNVYYKITDKTNVSMVWLNWSYFNHTNPTDEWQVNYFDYNNTLDEDTTVWNVTIDITGWVFKDACNYTLYANDTSSNVLELKNQVFYIMDNDDPTVTSVIIDWNPRHNLNGLDWPLANQTVVINVSVQDISSHIEEVRLYVLGIGYFTMTATSQIGTEMNYTCSLNPAEVGAHALKDITFWFRVTDASGRVNETQSVLNLSYRYGDATPPLFSTSFTFGYTPPLVVGSQDVELHAKLEDNLNITEVKYYLVYPNGTELLLYDFGPPTIWTEGQKKAEVTYPIDKSLLTEVGYYKINMYIKDNWSLVTNGTTGRQFFVTGKDDQPPNITAWVTPFIINTDMVFTIYANITDLSSIAYARFTIHDPLGNEYMSITNLNRVGETDTYMYNVSSGLMHEMFKVTYQRWPDLIKKNWIITIYSKDNAGFSSETFVRIDLYLENLSIEDRVLYDYYTIKAIISESKLVGYKFIYLENIVNDVKNSMDLGTISPTTASERLTQITTEIYPTWKAFEDAQTALIEAQQRGVKDSVIRNYRDKLDGIEDDLTTGDPYSVDYNTLAEQLDTLTQDIMGEAGAKAGGGAINPILLIIIVAVSLSAVVGAVAYIKKFKHALTDKEAVETLWAEVDEVIAQIDQLKIPKRDVELKMDEAKLVYEGGDYSKAYDILLPLRDELPNYLARGKKALDGLNKVYNNIKHLQEGGITPKTSIMLYNQAKKLFQESKFEESFEVSREAYAKFGEVGRDKTVFY